VKKDYPYNDTYDEPPIIDDIVKSPYAALRFILRHCDVRTSTPHSSGFARLASGAFYFVVSIMTFYEFIIIVSFRFLWDRYAR